MNKILNEIMSLRPQLEKKKTSINYMIVLHMLSILWYQFEMKQEEVL